MSRTILHPAEVTSFNRVRRQPNRQDELVELLRSYVLAGAEVDYLADVLEMRRRRIINLLSLSPKFVSSNIKRRFGDLCTRKLHVMTPSSVYVYPSGAIECHFCRRDRLKTWQRNHTTVFTHSDA